MKKRELKTPRGYHEKNQSKVALFAAQLDDQLKHLKDSVEKLTVEQLEWQQRPGMNTVGMLLAHLALVEVWWIKAAPLGLNWDPEGKKLIMKVCGVEDDGMPLPADGVHPTYLRGLTVDQYVDMLTKARRAIHRELKTWRDRDLDKHYTLNKKKFSRAWTVYHVLEHFASHFGQILLLKHLMRDAGVLVEEKK